MTLFRIFSLVLGLSLLAACEKNDLEEPPVPLGDFVLGHNIVVAANMEKVPISREASVEEWETEMKEAMANRFGRYEGTRIYNVGIAINAYALAPPGIPVVAAPKSVLVVTANIWDDATQTKLNPDGKQITVLESLSPDTVIGTGLTRSKKRQMEALSFNVAKKIEEWLVANPQWFTDTPEVGDMTKDQPDLLSALLPDAKPPEAATPTVPPGTEVPPLLDVPMVDPIEVVPLVPDPLATN